MNFRRLGFLVLIAFGAVMSTSCTSQPLKDQLTHTAQFNQFLDKTFDEMLNLSPESLAYFGQKSRYGELDDRSEAFEAKVQSLIQANYALLKKFDRSSLDPQAQLSYDIFKKDLENSIEDFKWKDYGYPINQQSGVHSDLPTFMINMHKVDTEQDLKDYISRLNQFKRAFDETLQQVARAEKAGVVAPKFVFPYVYEAAANVVKGAPFGKGPGDSPLYADFKAKLKKLKLPAAAAKDYLAQAEKALKESVAPAYTSLVAAMKAQEARATNDDGAWKFPKGAEYYATRLQRVTTTSMTADQIHELGLKNVERLRQDMTAIKDKMKFKGDLLAFFKMVRQDPKQYFPDTEAGRAGYLKMSRANLDTINKKVPEFFRLLPRAAMEVRAVEKFRQASAGKAFYEGPSDDGARPGVYYVNLRNMKDVPKFEAEALFYHEGVPGHHFQIALSIELKNLPKMRRYAHHTAFVEGWGLYTERLAKEMGGYRDDYAELGRLSMEMIRACRLVVDTGLHHKKWTRKQALDFFAQNLPVAEGMQIEQVERYIIWPGQATGYMVGMLKIVELRERAQKALGARFDIRDFHAVILENGSVPLDTLEQLVNAYIAGKQKG